MAELLEPQENPLADCDVFLLLFTSPNLGNNGSPDTSLTFDNTKQLLHNTL